MRKIVFLLSVTMAIFATITYSTLRNYNVINIASSEPNEVSPISDYSNNEYINEVGEGVLISSLYSSPLDKDIFERNKSNTQAYPVDLPTYTIVGILSSYDGTITGRQETLAKLWDRFGMENGLREEPALYNKKILVFYYQMQTINGKQPMILIGYAARDFLKDRVTVSGTDAIVMDIPKGRYWGYDVKGTSTNRIIKGWEYLSSTYPSDIKHNSLEIYTLDSDDVVESVALYLLQ